MFHMVNKEVGEDEIMMIGFDDFAFRAPRLTSTKRISPWSDNELSGMRHACIGLRLRLSTTCRV